jgi:hypothetical protein
MLEQPGNPKRGKFGGESMLYTAKRWGIQATGACF